MIWISLALISFFSFAQHPFDDLTEGEIKEALRLVKESQLLGAKSSFPVVKRAEPAKSNWLSGKANHFRQAYVAAFDYEKSLMMEFVVDLVAKEIKSSKKLIGIKPPVLLEEYAKAREIAGSDPRWLAALEKRNLKKEDVILDIWAPGLLSPEEIKPGKRLLRALTYFKGNGKNFYSRPIEGLVVTVDLSQNKVESFWDLGISPLAPGLREFDEKSNAPLIENLKPLKAQQPKGPSYEINGQEISWANWKIRYSMDPLQGLQIYHVKFVDQGKERSILYKLSLAEMLVPYGDPDKNWSFRNAFDVGEYGLGKTLHPLVLGEDVPSYATLLNVTMADDQGFPTTFPGAAVYERDMGLLWKHRNAENGDVDVRRARQLVLTFMTTIGNYDYGINYIFSLDGTIKVDAQLTGILLAKGTKMETNRCSGGCFPLVEKNILAPPHQHFFNFRIDLDIDSHEGNNAAEANVRALPQGKENPDGNTFISENTIFKKELEARRILNPQTARKWKVFSSQNTNTMNHPTGYMLMPEENSFPYLSPNNQIRKRAQFVNFHAWFTKYKDEEQSGAALYPTTAPAGEGLAKYAKDNETLTNQDVVLWYSFGVTHIPRPEEWPMMSVHHTGFALMPINFFNENPAMKVPENL